MDDRISVSRPTRSALPDFAGRVRTLSSGPSAWKLLHRGGKNILLLGLGPDDTWPATDASQVYWLEAPFMRQHLQQTPPPSSNEVTLEEALALFPYANVWLYEPGIQFAPEFWGHILGELFAANQPWRKTKRKTVLLFGDETALLHIELRETLRRAGFACVEGLSKGWEEHPEQSLAEACRSLTPTICLAINGRGLDSRGRLFGLLQALSIPCAIWFVDNPWHILSGIKLPWWKEAHLFVTDPSFIPLLQQEGAKSVHALPLAFSWHMWNSDIPTSYYSSPDYIRDVPLFVGRTAFPGKDRFFAACRLPKDVYEEATDLFNQEATLPDIHWWYNRLHPRFWPGNEARVSGLGADTFSMLNKVRWLKELTRNKPLSIVGDTKWSTFLPMTISLPAVDYYTELPELYTLSTYVFSITSLLLPHSLNQRHFDVWAAGGFLLTDATPGLEIFPEELTRPITLSSPKDYADREMFFLTSKEAYDLKSAWRECLWEKHSYLNRWETICSVCLNSQ